MYMQKKESIRTKLEITGYKIITVLIKSCIFGLFWYTLLLTLAKSSEELNMTEKRRSIGI